MIEELSQWGPLTSQCDGVIVGCAQNHEWMLPWWWMHYRMHNEYPVTFFDFGDLSPEAKNWCKKRGTLASLGSIEKFIAPKDTINAGNVKCWEDHLDLDPWKARLEWFKKPLACLKSPYARTIWIDVDCQVRKSLTPLFELAEQSGSFSVTEEPLAIRIIHEQNGILKEGEMEYNTGVIAFKHDTPLIVDWAKICLESNVDFRGDQEGLSRLAHDRGIRITPLPAIYNWRGNIDVTVEQSQDLVIIHWLGSCKRLIRMQLDALTKLAMNFSFND